MEKICNNCQLPKVLNYSYTGWHIDHKKALANFDLTDREQFLQAMHYTNLQPLWAKDNISKLNRII